MANELIPTVRAVLAPRIFRWGAGLVGAVAAYDAASSQFDLPKLGKLVGISGALLPWWGWLLILQAIFVFALFEYVRRNVPIQETKPSQPVITDESKRDIELDLTRLLYFALNQSTIAYLDKLIAEVPMGEIPRKGSSDQQDDVYREINNFISRVRGELRGTDRGISLEDALQSAEADAERELDAYLKDNPEGKGDFNKLRRFLIVEKQRDRVIPLLRRERDEVIAKVRSDRSDLIDRFQRRSSGHPH